MGISYKDYIDINGCRLYVKFSTAQQKLEMKKKKTKRNERKLLSKINIFKDYGLSKNKKKRFLGVYCIYFPLTEINRIYSLFLYGLYKGDIFLKHIW